MPDRSGDAFTGREVPYHPGCCRIESPFEGLIPVTSSLRRLRQEDYELEASLGYILTLSKKEKEREGGKKKKSFGGIFLGVGLQGGTQLGPATPCLCPNMAFALDSLTWLPAHREGLRLVEAGTLTQDPGSVQQAQQSVVFTTPVPCFRSSSFLAHQAHREARVKVLKTPMHQ